MPIEPPVARYRQVANELRGAIRAGQYAPGDQLPSETELVERYQLSRPTIRRAIAVLTAEGLVVVEHGRGAFVRPRPPVRLAFSRYQRERRRPSLGPFETTTAAQGVQGYGEVVAVEHHAADADVAARLDLDEEAPVVSRRRHMYAGEEVVQVQQSWFPADVAAGTELAGTAKITDGTYAALDRIGHGPALISEEIGARMPTPEEAAIFHAPPGVPVLVVWRTTKDASGRIVEVVQVTALADRNVFLYEDLPIERG